LLVVLIKKAIWTQNERRTADAVARQTFFSHSFYVPADNVKDTLLLYLVVAEGKTQFIGKNQPNQADWFGKGKAEWPFYFRKKGDVVEIHFNTAFEGSCWRPARFSRFHKQNKNEDSAANQWHRSSCLFKLAEGQSAIFKINYFHGNRTLAGASMAPLYQQFESYFVNTQILTPDLFERDYTYERDERVVLR
jgi:hypothetical protein